MEKDQLKLQKLVTSGDIVILPIGFRCYTKQVIAKKLGINQPSLPFDHGFFPPQAITSVILNPKVTIEYNQNNNVCIKTEMNEDDVFGLGIRFISTTYDHINSVLTSKDIPDINKYLDVTFGYYTLDRYHKFVLAHYNLHHFANKPGTKKITEPRENVIRIVDTLNRRIERMMQICNDASHIFMISEEHQNYKYMRLDDEYFILNDFAELEETCNTIFGSKFTIHDINVTKASDIMEIL